jgi:hypothetical protein
MYPYIYMNNEHSCKKLRVIIKNRRVNTAYNKQDNGGNQRFKVGWQRGGKLENMTLQIIQNSGKFNTSLILITRC